MTNYTYSISNKAIQKRGEIFKRKEKRIKTSGILIRQLIQRFLNEDYIIGEWWKKNKKYYYIPLISDDPFISIEKGITETEYLSIKKVGNDK